MFICNPTARKINCIKTSKKHKEGKNREGPRPRPRGNIKHEAGTSCSPTEGGRITRHSRICDCTSVNCFHSIIIACKMYKTKLIKQNQKAHIANLKKVYVYYVCIYDL